MEEEIRCIGCGARIQAEDKEALGFLPASALKKRLENDEDIYCQRCFRLRHYNEIVPTSLTDDDFLRLLNEIGQEDALIVNVVDIFDFNGSIIPGLHRLTGGNDVLLVANKKDVLPHSLKAGKLKAWLKGEASEHGLKPVDILVTSAKNKDDVSELMEAIEHYRHGRDVYVVGVTNVGKSTLINAIIKNVTGSQDVITTSRFPGTTLDKIEIPLDDDSQLIDTPGIIHRGQMAHYLDKKDLDLVSPKKEIKPRTFQLNPEQTLFLGGLARFDFISGEKQGMTAFFENGLSIHRTKLAGADDFYEKHAGELLQPVVEGRKLLRKEFSIKEKSDIVYSGLGWVRVSGPAVVAAWLPEGVDLVVRKALIG
ncbi:ribosome biogenesis GTPase YqeH [Lactococcus termiticola]|uniref:GTPase n=1 Tax=Lactococcus termiticola TaxID=2169526 RepID=A0A2R5HEV8_9LACT|nr:ribosome biogenesis GTPase YqeH [Lactococcus termiticola]GBG96593.1 GTPase [Lactococcus termiticola]